MLFSCISRSSLKYVQRVFSKRELVKTSFCTELKPTNLKNLLHISTESPKEGFNNTVFQYFMHELKRCNLDMRTDLQLLMNKSIKIFANYQFQCFCLYSIYLTFILLFCCLVHSGIMILSS